MTSKDFQQPLDSRRYRWLPQLIILMNLVALVAGVVLLRNVEDRLIAAAGEELTIAAAEVSDKLDRVLFERYGDAQMMAKAFALRASDIDVASVLGLGFPDFRGGALKYADDLGLNSVRARLERFADCYGERFSPCPLLRTTEGVY